MDIPHIVHSPVLFLYNQKENLHIRLQQVAIGRQGRGVRNQVTEGKGGLENCFKIILKYVFFDFQKPCEWFIYSKDVNELWVGETNAEGVGRQWKHSR